MTASGGKAGCEPGGEIKLRLRIVDGRVAGASLSSSRPRGLARLFVGKAPAEVIRTLPLLFNICATAQSVASAQAFERAVGINPGPLHHACRNALVTAESIREHLTRVLLGWTTWLGEAPSREAIAVIAPLRRLAGALSAGDPDLVIGGGPLEPDRARLSALLSALERVLEQHVLGLAPARWLRLTGAEAFGRWLATSDALGARTLRHAQVQGLNGLANEELRPLGVLSLHALEERLSGADAEHFVAEPTWDGLAHETGALARELGRDPLRAGEAVLGRGVGLRLLARLCELARLSVSLEALLASVQPARGSMAPLPSGADGVGIGLVEAARGRLIHRVALSQGVVSDYCILAPTEWNFHPRGVAARSLIGLLDDERLEANAGLIIEAIDPCVAYAIKCERG